MESDQIFKFVFWLWKFVQLNTFFTLLEIVLAHLSDPVSTEPNNGVASPAFLFYGFPKACIIFEPTILTFRFSGCGIGYLDFNSQVGSELSLLISFRLLGCFTYLSGTGGILT